MLVKNKPFEITLPDSDTKLVVSYVNASKLVLILGGIPDHFFNAESKVQESQEEAAKAFLEPKNQMVMATWACEGIVEHGEYKIVPKFKDLADDEYSFFDLSIPDQLHLLTAVRTGLDPKKKEAEQSN